MDILGILNFTLSVAIGVLILVVLVVLHELGHAVVARRNGVVVEEFGIGFPPRAWSKKLKNGILFTLNWLPLGGFVKLQGENDSANKKGDYGKASLWAKTKILFAGVTVNWLTAAILLGVLSSVGLPKLIDGQFYVAGDVVIDKQPLIAAKISEGLPADKAGVKEGDEIVSFAGQTLYEARDLNTLTKENQGKTVELVYLHAGEKKSVQITLRSNNDDKKGYLGIGGQQDKVTTYRSTWSAPIVGVALTGQLTGYTLNSLGDTLVKFVTGLTEKVSLDGEVRKSGDTKLDEVGNNVGGPIAILGTFFPSAREGGLVSLTLATAFISLTLAVMNLLPIPALDGGRWFVTMLYRVVLRKPLTKEKEERIHGTGLYILLGLIVLVSIADIGKLGQ